MQQAPPLRDRLLGSSLIGDVANHALITNDAALFVTDSGRAIGEPQDAAIALTHLILESANRPVTFHSLLVPGARVGIDVNRLRTVAYAAEEVVGGVISQHTRQRRIGVEQLTGRRRDIDSVDRTFEQLAIALLGKTLLGKRPNGSFARGVRLSERPAKHHRGPCDIPDLVIDLG